MTNQAQCYAKVGKSKKNHSYHSYLVQGSNFYSAIKPVEEIDRRKWGKKEVKVSLLWMK